MNDESELHEAVECWRNTDGFASSDQSECFEQVYTLAEAYLASLDRQRREAEEWTTEWLQSIGFDFVADFRGGFWMIETPYDDPHHLRHTKVAVDSGRSWYANGLGCKACVTRGDVLRLLSALGIQQKDGER